MYKNRHSKIDAIQSSADVSSLQSALNLLKSNLCPRSNVWIMLKIRLQGTIFRYFIICLNTLYTLAFRYEAKRQRAGGGGEGVNKQNPIVLYPFTSQGLYCIVCSKCTFCCKSYFSLQRYLFLHVIYI